MTEDNEIVDIGAKNSRRCVRRGIRFRTTSAAPPLPPICRRVMATSRGKNSHRSAVEVAVAGRVMLRRVMGKASFFTLQDVSGRIQCYVRREQIGDAGVSGVRRRCGISATSSA